MYKIAYFYPYFHLVSFQFIAKHHVNALKKIAKVTQFDESVFYRRLALFFLPKYDSIFLHPLFYLALERYKHLLTVKRKCDLLVGVDVADSTLLSPKAVKVANFCDLIIVPSSFSKEVYHTSGVDTDIEVVPHGVSKIFVQDDLQIVHPILQKLLRLKFEKGYIYVLYFLWHSWKRKGAHIVYSVVQKIQEKYRNVILLLKTGDIYDPFVEILMNLRTIRLEGYISRYTLAQLYRIADVLLVPSLAGGFELNALEGIVSGLPTIIPNSPFFNDYKHYAITIPEVREVELYEDNPIHIGKGFEPTVESTYETLVTVIEHLDYYKEIFQKQKWKVYEEFKWDRIYGKLIEIIKKYLS